jgi:hypothetical protein
MLFKLCLLLSDFVRMYPYMRIQKHLFKFEYVVIDYRVQILNMFEDIMKNMCSICNFMIYIYIYIVHIYIVDYNIIDKKHLL